ncbi:siderophore-interacting protein, partial [Pedococcus sp. 2YAF34]|uniref:siderophore-interacting protein n=1 Tax=Pedococcus sp. 2YAF34 TaxID=3233032 RepID=UPI003F96A32B
MSRPRPITPRHPHVLLLEVVRSERISPNFQRVTVGGAALDLFEPMGRDQWFRLFIPHRPDEKPALPASAGARWWPQVLAMPEARRPFVRNYTVAGHRAADRELDIDFVLHESPGGHDAAAGRPSTAPSMSPYGVASDWATEAVPGRLVGLLDQGVMWNPPADTQHILVATD